MRASEWSRAAVLACTLAMLAPGASTAQMKPSEPFRLIQIVDGDTIAISGSRPSRRGREIYGTAKVPWGKSWTPGADMATVLRVDRDFSINGTAMPAGAYSIWMIPRADDQWTMFLDPDAELFHTAHPDTVGQRHVVPLVARAADTLETLTWSVNEIRGWRSRVELSWAGKAVDFELRLSSGDLQLAVADSVAARLVGTYDVSPDARQGPVQVERVVVERSGEFLTWRFEGGNAPEWADGTTWLMIPRGGETFGWAMLHEGEVVGLVEWLVVEVPESSGPARRLEFRTVPRDDLLSWAVRRP